MNTYWLKGLSPNERLYENIIQHPVGMKNNNKNIMRYMAQEKKKEGKETTTTKKQNSPVVSKYFRSNDAVCVWIPLIFFTLRIFAYKKKSGSTHKKWVLPWHRCIRFPFTVKKKSTIIT